MTVIILFPLLFAACTDEDNTELNKGDNPLILQSSSDTLDLDVFMPEVRAIIFEWTSGTNHGTNAAISYTFQMGVKGSDFENGITVDMGKDALFKEYTHRHMNNILLDTLGLEAGVEVEIEVRVTARVLGQFFAPEATNTVTVRMKPFVPIATNLYLTGNATPNGWNADKATPMTPIRSTPGAFTWQGHIKAGELKFITTLGQFIPSYGKGENDYTLSFRETENDPDNKFVFTGATAGVYRIDLNIVTGAIKLERLSAVEYAELWFVGEATDWLFEPMVADLSNPNIFYYNSVLPKDGEFKIATATNFDESTVYFHPSEDGVGTGTDMDVEKWAGGDDSKWSLTAGTYKIKLNVESMKIDIVSFTPYNPLYMVGSAAPAGWNIENPTEMTSTDDPFVFTYTGTLAIDNSVGYGEFKFPVAKGDWATDYFMPPTNWEGINGSRMILVEGGSPDNKWRIDETGIYTVTINQLKETISIVKQ